MPKVPEGLRDAGDLGAGDASPHEALLPGVGVGGPHRLSHGGVQRGLVGLAVLLHAEARILAPLGMAEHVAAGRPDLPGDAEHEPALVAGPERTVRHLSLIHI